MRGKRTSLLCTMTAALVVATAGCANHPAQPGSAAANDASQRQDDAVKYAMETGYRETPNAKGIEVYCRNQSVIGTHFSNQVCYTPDQLARMFANDASMRDRLIQPFACTGTLTCGQGK